MQISIKQLTKVYRGDVRALNGIDLEISNGMFGLLGPNGAGKTTLMRTLATLLRPTSGSIRVGEYDATTERGRQDIKSLLGYLPQDLGMYPDLTAREFLDYIGILKGLTDRKVRRGRSEELLEIVSLQQVANRKLKTYSGGMKRRVGIAQALLNDPKLLIVDEPTAGLDPEERIRFRNLLSDLQGDRIVLLSTHIVEDISQTCRNLALIKSGRVLFQGTTAEMVQAAQGKVWLITTAGMRPEGNFTQISALNLGATNQYRVVGERPVGGQVIAVEPNLEDGYVWSMQQQLAGSEAFTA